MNEQVKTHKKIAELERLAERVLKAKKKWLSRRPIVIEFSGSPKSGKSSCISSLDIFLRRNDFRTKVLTERASVCPIENKFDPLFNVWNACDALNQLSEIIANRPRDYDVIIMDRGFFDSICWFEWQKRRNLLSDDDFLRFNAFFTAIRFRMMIDLVIHFDAEPRTSLIREYKNLLTRKEGSVMRDSVLQGYREAAKSAQLNFSDQFRQFHEFKTDDIDQNEVSAQVTGLVLDKLHNVASERIAYINRELIESAFNGRDFVKFSDISHIIDKNIKFEDREKLDFDDYRQLDFSKIQIIPLILLKDKGRFRFVVARKGKQAASSNSPEADRILLYFGGHIREEDRVLYNHDVKSIEIISQCIFREIKEELGIDVRINCEDPICVWIRDGKKSEVHMAVAFIQEKDLDNIKLNIDEREFVLLTKKEKYGTGVIIDENGIKENIDRIDSWSRTVLREKLNWEDLVRGQGDLLE